MDTRHSIDELIFEFNFDSLPDARTFEEELSTWLRNALLPPFESLLDSLSGAGEMLRFDTLQIDLGDIPAADFKNELRIRMLAKLRAVLEEKVQQFRHEVGSTGGQTAGAIAQSDSARAELQRFLDFLISGKLAWQTSGDPASSHEQLLQRVLQSSGKLLFGEIARSARRDVITMRLIRQFSPHSRIALLRAGLQLSGGLLTELAEAMQLVSVAAATAHYDEPGDASIDVFWEILFETAWRDAKGNEESLAVKAVESFARAAGIVVMNRISQLIDASQTEQKYSSALVHVLKLALGQNDIGQIESSKQETIHGRVLDEAWLRKTCGALRQGTIQISSLKLDAHRMAQLVAHFIAYDEAAGIGNRGAFAQAIESHAAQSSSRESYYSRVLQTLLKRQLVDLEAIARESGRSGEHVLTRHAMKGDSAHAGSNEESNPPSGGAFEAPGNAADNSAGNSAGNSADEKSSQLRFRLVRCLLDGDAAQLESMWHLLFRRYATLTRDALRHYGKFERVRRQFVERFSPSLLRDFVELIEPGAVPVFSYIGEHASSLALRDTDTDAWRRDVWGFAFDRILGEDAADFDFHGFVESVMRYAIRRTAEIQNMSPAAATRDLIDIWRDAFDEETPEIMRTVLQKIGEQAGLTADASLHDANTDGHDVLVNLRRQLSQAQASQFAPGSDVRGPDSGNAGSSAENVAQSECDSRTLATSIDVLVTNHPAHAEQLFATYRRGEFPWEKFDFNSEQLRRLLQFHLRRDAHRPSIDDDLATSERVAILHRIERSSSAMGDAKVLYLSLLEQLEGRSLDVARDGKAAENGSATLRSSPGPARHPVTPMEDVKRAAPQSATPQAPRHAKSTMKGNAPESAMAMRAEELALVWQKIKIGETKLAALRWTAANFAALTEVAIISVAQSIFAMHAPSLGSIEECAARAKRPDVFYSLVLERLASDRTVDLETLLEQSNAGVEIELNGTADALDASDTNAPGNEFDRADALKTLAADDTDAIAIMWLRMRQQRINPVALGWRAGEMKKLLQVAIESNSVATDSGDAAKMSPVDAGLRGHEQAKVEPGQKLGPQPLRQPDSEQRPRLLRKVREYATRSADASAFYLHVLASLAEGTQVDLEQALKKSGIAAGAAGEAFASNLPAHSPRQNFESQFARLEQFASDETVGEPVADASIDDMDVALRHAIAQQGDRMRVAFFALREKLAGPLAALSDDELLILIDRYLEVIAGSDLGNRRVFLGAVESHAGTCADKARFLRLIFARLLRRETVDLEALAEQAGNSRPGIDKDGRLDKSDESKLLGNGAGLRANMAPVREIGEGDDIRSNGLQSWQPYAETQAGTTDQTRSEPTKGTAAASEMDDSISPGIWRQRIQAEIARQSHDDLARQAAFLHAIENHAQLARDLAQYYRRVFETLVQNEVVDLEAIVAESSDETIEIGGANTGIVPKGDAAAKTYSDGGRLRAAARDETQILAASDQETWRASLLQAVNRADMPTGRVLLLGLTGENAGALAKTLTPNLADPSFNEKLVGLFSSTELAPLLAALLGQHGNAVTRYADAAGEALHFLSEDLPRRRAFVMAWRASFDYFFVQRGTFGKTAFPTMLAARLAREAGLRSTRPLRELMDAGAAGYDHLPTQTMAARATDSTSDTKQLNDGRKVEAKLPKDMGRLPGLGPVRPQAGRSINDSDMGNAEADAVASNIDVHVENAGLVLAWPYLPRLFGLLDLMEHNAFVSREAAERAVHLLQFMATGQTSTPEYALVLNKQLCGVATGLPIVAGIEISDRERETIENLIGGMIQNWKAIGNTSIEGFRQSFLQRQGWLSLQEEVWHLRVQTRAFDMLLDQLPWGISMVKHAWMVRPIHVKWR